ncbi:DUF4234 domain-containing protein [Candidatus Saccharibacteria bacterium]|nr:DUF4234 domain-containing protein [Candidatus Saccharibacteria bacterium]
MQKRNSIAVVLFSVFTFGIYNLYWLVSTKEELNQRGGDVPTAWLSIIPLVSIWWTWKYSQAVQLATKDQVSAGVSFLLLILIGNIGNGILQSYYNDTK